MKKYVVSLLTGVLLSFALTTAVLGAREPEMNFAWDDGSIYTNVSVAPVEYDYLGTWLIENLYSSNDQPWNWNFTVKIFDDSVESVVYHSYFVNRNSGIYIEEVPGYFHSRGGRAYLEFGEAKRLDPVPTQDAPFVFTHDIRDAWLFTQLFQRYDEHSNPMGFIGYAVANLTVSQVMEFQQTGKLPLQYGWDIASYFNLTQLQDKLVDYVAPNMVSAVPQLVNPSTSTVYVNGEARAFEAYNIGGHNFFKLRDIAFVLSGSDKQFDVTYNSQTNAIDFLTGQPYTIVGGELASGDASAKNAVQTTSRLYLDGNEMNLIAYNIAGNNFFKLRDIMSALDIFVGYDAETNSITVDTSNSYSEDI